MSTKTMRVRIEGSVQGVGFRAWAVSQAQALKLNGWVRNRTDGTVEMLLSGPQIAVERMLSLCGRGPDTADVTDLIIADEAATPEPGFQFLPTE